MKKINLVLGSLLICVVFLSGCLNISPEALAMANPLVKQFMEQYPNAKITVTHFTAEQSGQILENISAECGNPYMTAKEYYRISIDDPDSGLKAIAWVDWETKNIECAVKYGGGLNKTISKPGEPITDCKSHAEAKCYGEHVYWFDACGHKEEKKEYCQNGCENGFCKAAAGQEGCIKHAEIKCYEGHVYWYDSCSNKESKKEYCANGCESGACKTTGNEEKVCCESYGYGDQMVKCCETYEWTTAEECKVPENFVGGGKDIVDRSHCAGCGDGVCESIEKTLQLNEEYNFTFYGNAHTVKFSSFAPYTHTVVIMLDGVSKEMGKGSTLKVSGMPLKFASYSGEGQSVQITLDIGESQDTCAIDCGGQSICTDSDSGKNYYVKGTVEFGTQSLTDYCNEDGTLTEKYCENNEIKVETVNCPQGYECEDARCILQNQTEKVCEDTDNGKDYYKKGYLDMNDEEIGEMDVCFFVVGEPILAGECFGSNCWLKEFYCNSTNPDGYSAYDYQCPLGCRSGICKNETGCTVELSQIGAGRYMRFGNEYYTVKLVGYVRGPPEMAYFTIETLNGTKAYTWQEGGPYPVYNGNYTTDIRMEVKSIDAVVSNQTQELEQIDVEIYTLNDCIVIGI